MFPGISEVTQRLDKLIWLGEQIADSLGRIAEAAEDLRDKENPLNGSSSPTGIFSQFPDTGERLQPVEPIEENGLLYHPGA